MVIGSVKSETIMQRYMASDKKNPHHPTPPALGSLDDPDGFAVMVSAAPPISVLSSR